MMDTGANAPADFFKDQDDNIEESEQEEDHLKREDGGQGKAWSF